MKKLTRGLIFLVILVLTVPVFAQEEQAEQEDKLTLEWTQVRYRFEHEVSSVDGSGDMSEYFDDDFGTELTFTKGNLRLFFGLEVADSKPGGDSDPQSSYADALGDYGAIWTPESLADSDLQLQIGGFNGVSFGKLTNNADGVHGNIVVSWKMGGVDLALGYGKRYEGNTNDDADGDNHLIRGKVALPVGGSFNIGAYTALYMGNDVLLREASDALPEVKGNDDIIIGGFEFAGNVSSANLYSELGFATGQDVTEIDLSGFYAMGGASVPVGQVTLGIEAGFGTGADDPPDAKDEGFIAINSDFWRGKIMHADELITHTNGARGGISNIIYALLTADMNPTEKLDLSTGFLYLKPVEEIGGAENYGMEVYGSANYQLADYVSYGFYWGVGIPDEDFVDESLYQVWQRLQFSF